MLSDDEGLQEIFTKREIAELQAVLAEFDTLVLTNTKSLDISEGYRRLSEQLTYDPDNTSWKSLDNAITEFAQETINDLRSDSLFDELWESHPLINLQTQDSLILAGPKTFDSKFSSFMAYCVRKDERLKPYEESIQACGGIGPTLFYGFPRFITKLDMADPCIRLFAAIHFINARNEQKYNPRVHGAGVEFPKIEKSNSSGIYDQLFNDSTIIEAIEEY